MRTKDVLLLMLLAAMAGACEPAGEPMPAAAWNGAATPPNAAIDPGAIDASPIDTGTIDTGTSAAGTIDSLIAHPAMQRAFDAVVAMEPRTLHDHIALTEIPAPPFGEGPRALVFAELLERSGADSVWIDAEGNVLARIAGSAPRGTIAFSAHLDTVFPEGTDVTVRTRGDTLFAPGIGDDTRGLAVLLAMLRAVREAGIQFHDDVLLVGTVGEEGLGDLRGVRHLFSEHGPGIDAFVSIDGGRIGDIVNQALGSRRYRIVVKGEGGHSWGAFGTANPQHALASIVHFFVEKADPYTLDGPKTSYNIGRVEGGTSVNAIPESAWMEVDLRSVDPQRLAGIDALLQTAVEHGLAHQNGLKRRGAPLTVRVEPIGNRPSGATPSTDPLVVQALSSARAFGGDARLSMASTDANIPISMGIPAITIGRGGMGGGAHTLDEWWINADGHLAIQWALVLLAARAGIAS